MHCQIKSAIADATDFPTENQSDDKMAKGSKKKTETRRGHSNNNFDSQDGKNKKKLARCMDSHTEGGSKVMVESSKTRTVNDSHKKEGPK